MLTPPAASTTPLAQRLRRRWELAFAFTICAAATWLGYVAADGFSLGAVFAGQCAIVMVVPPLLDGSLERRLKTAFGAVMGVALVLMSLIGRNEATIGQWVDITAILAAVAVALVGCCTFLGRLKVPRTVAAAATVAIFILWLTWPIWLSPEVSGVDSHRLVDWLVFMHPPLVSNGVLTHASPWTEQTIAYQLTSLDQDVAILLPGDAWQCVLGHVLIGSGLIAASYVGVERKKNV